MARADGRLATCRQWIPEDKIWSFLTQLTLALSECHSEVDSTGDRKNVILHRDLKPDNGQFLSPHRPLALLRPKRLTCCWSPRAVFIGHNECLKLGDFGLSKAMAQAAMTQTYVGVSSPRPSPYHSPPFLPPIPSTSTDR